MSFSMSKKRLLVLYFCIGAGVVAWTQEVLPPDLTESVQDEAGEWDLDELGTLPLDINRIRLDQLRRLGILTPQQQQAFLNYREEYGPFLSLYELQAVPGWDPELINRILPYLSCGEPGLADEGEALRYIREGKTTLSWYNRFVSRQAAQESWLGQPVQWQFRIRHQYPDRLSLGFQAEKDAGEKSGLAGDHQSYHIQLIRPLKGLDQVILGDYKVSWGQGLLVFQGYHSQGSGAGAGRSAQPFRPHTGMDEHHFFRGIAIAGTIRSGLRAHAFYSLRSLDANLNQTDHGTVASSIPKGGLHRTTSEAGYRHVLPARTAGLRLEWEKSGQKVGFQGIWGGFAHPLDPPLNYYNRQDFRGSSLWNGSFDHELQFGNLYLFGEWAYGGNTSFAALQGMQLSLGKNFQLSLLYRNYAIDYQSLYGNAYAQTSKMANEKGLLWQLRWSPISQLRVEASTDLWHHRGPVYRERGPSGGQQQHLRISYQKRKQYMAYLLLESQLTQTNLYRLRLHLETQLSPDWEYRIRFNAGKAGVARYGSALQQDLLYRPAGKKWHFTGRIALIHTPDYDLRFYSYENGLLNQFSIAPYYGKGIKSYLNIRYKGLRNTTIEAGINHLARPSGAPEGPGNTRISFQIRYEPRG